MAAQEEVFEQVTSIPLFVFFFQFIPYSLMKMQTVQKPHWPLVVLVERDFSVKNYDA